MERLVLSPEEEGIITAWQTENASQLDPEPAAGTNIVVGDHLQVDNSWEVVVMGGLGGVVGSFIPAWGGLCLPIDLVDYITDRAGPPPGNATMPIFDEQQMQARTAAKAGAPNPKEAARAERKEERAERREDRDLKHALRDAIKRLPHKEQKHAREVLRAKGVLGKDDGDE